MSHDESQSGLATCPTWLLLQISYHVQLALRMDYIHNPSTAAARLCYHNSVSSIALHPRMASNNHASELVRQAECVERLVMMSAKFGDEVVITLHVSSSCREHSSWS